MGGVEGWVRRTEGWMEGWKDRSQWVDEGLKGGQMCGHGRLQGQLEGRRKGWLEGKKGGWMEGEGKAGWVLEGNGTEKGSRAAVGQGGQGPGAVRCMARQRGSS